ncbi:MAG: hypothetical protein F4051_09735 [Boseongicola sp. SB0670_bin_30]|nr:hypothetical protein [Boseongicola sp. SB0670_bin_30]
MDIAARPACLALMLALGACSSGEERASTRPTSFDGEVLRIAVLRADGRTERFSSLRDEWYSWSWFPFMPNHSGRRWTMGKTDRDGVSLAYALVSWDNDDPTDYLSAGFWMRFDGARTTRRLNPADAEIVPFIDGPELDARHPPELPVSGTAAYAGSAGGVYRYRQPGAEPLAEEFTATITLEADFAAGTVAGCIGCVGDIALEREHLYALLGWRRGDAVAGHPPTGYEIRFAPAAIGATGGFEGASVAVTHPDRAIVGSDGSWSGRFSSRPAGDGTPRLAAGHASAAFAEADGGEGSFDSIFTVLHPTLLPEPPRDDPRPGP